MRPYDHPSRALLHEEVHARPPIPLWPNERVISQSFLLDAATRQQQIAWVQKLSSALGCALSSDDHSFMTLYLAPEPERVLVKWELHGEFATIAVIIHNKTKVKEPLLKSRLEIEHDLEPGV
uniref:Uncharacterized protein n=1 Tax=Polynucleobacter necessarius subsp. necessarius (strain STIR1) TaxID=452638 RepID=B1XVB1_POLNS